MKKKLRGYIFSRSFMGERAPQHVQNIVIRNYCEKNDYIYLLSSVEYKMKNSYLMLEQIMKDLKNVSGIVAYSMFQLPEKDRLRNSIYKRIISQKKEIHFSVEELKIATKEDCRKIEDIWLVKKTLNYCPSSIKKK